MYPTARTITLSGFFLLLLLNASCAVSSGSDPALVCNSGDTRECVCSGGLSGGQVCLQRRWAPWGDYRRARLQGSEPDLR